MTTAFTPEDERPIGPIRVWILAWPLLRRIGRRVLAFEIVWKLASFLVLGPLTTAILNAAISVGHGRAVTNEALLGFAASPTGLATLFLWGVLTQAVGFFEGAGLVALVVSALRERPVRLREVIARSVRDASRLVGLAAVEVAAAGLVVAPMAALAWGVATLLLGGADINFYLETRPPRFYVAAGLVGAIGLVTAAALAWLFVRWVFAVPASLFERRRPLAALRASARMVRGRGWRVFGSILVWQAGKLLGFAGLALALDYLSGAVLAAVGTSRPIVLGAVALLMLVDGGVFALASMADVIGFGLLVGLLYEEGRRASDEPAAGRDPEAEIDPASPRARPTRRKRLAIALGVALGLGGLTAGQAILVVRRFADRHPVAVTAHRAGPRPAAENSLAALALGIAAGADFAEIDVQETRDGAIVVVHDADLRRLAGIAREVRDLSLDEARAAGLATLDDFLAASRGKIRLNIELKYYANPPDPKLARDVVDLLHARNVADAIVTSLEPQALAQVRRLDRSIPVGPIVTANLGDLTRLDVDFLSLRQGLVTPTLIRAARRRGLEIHAWTVDDRAAAIALAERGVDNLITDDPAPIRRALAWRDGLTDVELVLLRFREWLGSTTFRRLVPPDATPSADFAPGLR